MQSMVMLHQNVIESLVHHMIYGIIHLPGNDISMYMYGRRTPGSTWKKKKNRIYV